MESSLLVQRIKADISQARANGTKEVSLERLEQYVDEISGQEKIHYNIDRLSSLYAQRKLEIWKHKRQRVWDELFDKSQWKRESWKIKATYRFEAFKIRANLLSQAGLATVKALLWLNGGGAAALLAFLATLANAKGTPPFKIDLESVRCGLVALFVGAGMAAASPGVDYTLGAALLETKKPGLKRYLNRALKVSSIIAGFVSLAAFIVGGYFVYLGLLPV